MWKNIQRKNFLKNSRNAMHKRMTIAVLLCIASATFGISCSQAQQLETIELSVGNTQMTVEVADEAEERAIGLMYRQSMPENYGMLFVYPREMFMYFYMKNTYIPLSIAFINSQGLVVDIQDMEPLDETTIRSAGLAKYALEVNQGAFETFGVEVGDIIVIPENLSAGLE